MPPPAVFLLKGEVTGHTTVKWAIDRICNKARDQKKIGRKRFEERKSNYCLQDRTVEIKNELHLSYFSARMACRPQ